MKPNRYHRVRIAEVHAFGDVMHDIVADVVMGRLCFDQDGNPFSVSPNEVGVRLVGLTPAPRDEDEARADLAAARPVYGAEDRTTVTETRTTAWGLSEITRLTYEAFRHVDEWGDEEERTSYRRSETVTYRVEGAPGATFEFLTEALEAQDGTWVPFEAATAADWFGAAPFVGDVVRVPDEVEVVRGEDAVIVLLDEEETTRETAERACEWGMSLSVCSTGDGVVLSGENVMACAPSALAAEEALGRLVRVWDALVAAGVEGEPWLAWDTSVSLGRHTLVGPDGSPVTGREAARALGMTGPGCQARARKVLEDALA